MTAYRDIFRAPPLDWPHRGTSRHIACRPHRWHVQAAGRGPTLLLIHGAGASTHSWRHLMPLLSADYHIVAVDLPGQGFSQWGTRTRSGLDAMAVDLATLSASEGWQPTALIGHSAGGAIALRLAGLLPEPPRAVVGINAALDGFEGVAGWLFPALARLLTLNPLIPHLFSRLSGSEAGVAALLASTGSTIDATGQKYYRHLVNSPAHVDATLAMMAQWSLDGLLRDLPTIPTPCLLITATQDRAVPPETSEKAARRMMDARTHSVQGYGHLIHEEAAETLAPLITGFLQDRL